MNRFKFKISALGFATLMCTAILCVSCGGGGGIASTGTVALTRGLIHEWKFDGDTNDSVGGLNGTAVGAVSYLPGPVGQAIVLDGNTMGVTLPPVPDMQFQASFSISAWANLKSYPTGGKAWTSLIFDGDDRGGLDSYFIQVDPYGNLVFEIDSAASPNAGISIGGVMPLNTFVLITATYDQPSGAMRLYLNGKLTSEYLNNSTLTPVEPLDPSSNPGTGIGTNNAFPVSSYNYCWNGEIDDMRIYNRSLNAAEALALFNQGGAIPLGHR